MFAVLLAASIGTAGVKKDSPGQEKPLPWYKQLDAEWGGHIKSTGHTSWHDDRTIYRIDEENPYFDTGLDFRLKNKLFLSETSFFDIHYEAILISGDTIQEGNELRQMFFGMDNLPVARTTVNDDRRLFNLTSSIEEEDSYSLYHRLDRFQIALQPEWGSVCIGRQALTWGNGLLFNPMDLFNPFSPTEIDRDYKMGDDMVSAQISTGSIGDFEFIVIPRRDPVIGEVKTEYSSVAGKQHFFLDSKDIHIMFARHYDENVVGIGSTGYLYDAVWRTDIIWSSLRQKEDKKGYFSVVANMDYSWVWWNKNIYGLVEYYYNELGTDQYSEVYLNSEIMDRLERGELFSQGKSYLGAQLNIELHPLLSFYITSINNLEDPSGTLQSWIGWNISQNTQLTFGGNLYYGGDNTEFGGYVIESTSYKNKPSPNIFLWLTCYF